MTGYILEEETLETIEKSVSGDPKIHCLIGHGVGNQYYSKADLRYLGIWTQDVYEVPHGFKDANGILKPWTDAKYAQRQMDYIWSVGYYQDEEHKILLRAGDFVTLEPIHEPSEYLSCQNIETQGDGRIKLELGAKRPTFLDAKETIQNSPHGYIDRYMRENHEAITQSASIYPSDPAHDADDITLYFNVPDKVTNAVDRPIITISPSLRPSAGTDPNYGRVGIRFAVDGTYSNFGYLTATTIGEAFGDSLPEIDITSIISENGLHGIQVDVRMIEEYGVSHSDYTGHPAISASISMNFYKRGELTA